MHDHAQGIRALGQRPARPCPCGGATRNAALGDALAWAAEALASRYGMFVSIRFAPDRRSGGAWLVTHSSDGMGKNAEIGIVAATATDGATALHAYVGTRSLAHAAVANSERDDATRRYAYVPCDGIATAMAFLEASAVLLPSYDTGPEVTVWAYDARQGGWRAARTCFRDEAAGWLRSVGARLPRGHARISLRQPANQPRRAAQAMPRGIPG